MNKLDHPGPSGHERPRRGVIDAESEADIRSALKGLIPDADLPGDLQAGDFLIDDDQVFTPRANAAGTAQGGRAPDKGNQQAQKKGGLPEEDLIPGLPPVVTPSPMPGAVAAPATVAPEPPAVRKESVDPPPNPLPAGLDPGGFLQGAGPPEVAGDSRHLLLPPKLHSQNEGTNSFSQAQKSRPQPATPGGSVQESAGGGAELSDNVQKGPSPPQPGPVRDGPVLPSQELSPELWEPETEPPWWVRWRTGWRLALVIVLLVGGYGAWRGRRDYDHFKRWRADKLAAEALEKAPSDPDAAQSLLDQAVILAPGSPAVLRAMVEFCEPRGDRMALFALRQLVLTSGANVQDWERLCRLSLDWDHPELLPVGLVSAWAALPENSLSPGQLKIVCRWLTNRGMAANAELRLREALRRGESDDLKLVLAGVLLNLAGNEGYGPGKSWEAVELLESLSRNPGTPVIVRSDAARMLATIILSRSNRGLLNESRAALLLKAFAELAATSTPGETLRNELAGASLKIAVDEKRRTEITREMAQKAAAASGSDRLMICRWLNDNGAMEEALRLHGQTSGAPRDREWFTVKLDALFALQRMDEAVAILQAADQPLPAVLQKVFLYRLAAARNADATEMKNRRLEVVQASSDPPDNFRAAEMLEKLGDRDTAQTLYRRAISDERIGLAARLGIVRCLNAFPERTPEQIIALESVLQLWPHLDDARSDLIYLRLLEGATEPGDMEKVTELASRAPRYLSYRISAALAELQSDHPARALALLESEPLPWRQLPNGWQAVYCAVLAANGRAEAAKALSLRLLEQPLRPGEKKLLDRYVKSRL